MEILVLPILILVLWVIFAFYFLAKKSAEGTTRESVNKFWFKFFGWGIGCGLFFNFIFDSIGDQNILPLALQDSILPQLGFLVGLIIGIVYVLVTHERKN